VAEDDDQGMVSFTGKLGDRVQIIGDDYLVTSASHGLDMTCGAAVGENP
jgi:enolase